MPMIKKGGFYILILIVFLQSCVERYYLNEYVEFKPRLVVDAFLNDLDSIQKIKISFSTSPELPYNDPVPKCNVFVVDDSGNRFTFKESWKKGNYTSVIGKEHLVVGSKYKLTVETPEGVVYTTNFEEVKSSPEIDSVYYELERKPTKNPSVTEDGYQFYVDLLADEKYGRYFRWIIDESWEYHSTFPIARYIDENRVLHTGPPDSSRFVCYKTQPASDILILTTNGLTENKFFNNKLHFVNDHTQKLLYRYSILIKQISISKNEYVFWENILKNNQESGGLFDKQPAVVVGNVFNAADTNDKVLGYFSVTSIKTKRINIDAVTDLSFKNIPYCQGRITTDAYGETPPVYFTKIIDPRTGKGVYGVANDECFDCTLLGGTTDLPLFWKKNE